MKRNDWKVGFYESADGLAYISENRIRYEFLEGTTISTNHKPYTSDIVFIMVNEPDFDEMLESRLVGFMAGATFLCDDNEELRNEYRGYIAEDIESFERTHADFVQAVKGGNK